ncbi:hypothetical protein EI94DRAFT_1304097 [Lactarius quietus]|nr:hypothetical protein EI94DRAFT_1304097 [Lactarius quietus]
MAFLCLLCIIHPTLLHLFIIGEKKCCVGIRVDVHTHRITNRLKSHKLPTKNPKGMKLNMQSWLPTEFHKEINHLLVWFWPGSLSARLSKCEMCVPNTQDFCPNAQTVAKSNTRRTDTVKAKSGPHIDRYRGGGGAHPLERGICVTLPDRGFDPHA